MPSKLFMTLAGSYFWYFGLLGLFVPYTSIWLDNYGFNSQQIGEILAFTMIARIIGPSLWSHFADRSGRQRIYIQLGSVLALLSFLLLFFNQLYWFIVLILCCFMLFHTAIQPQLEVLTQSIVRKSPKLYARIRLWGSLGFVTVAVLSGIFIEVHVRDFYLISGTTILILLLFNSFLIPQPRVRRNTGKTLVKIRYKLLHKHFVAFFIAGLLLQMSFGPYYSFFALYLRDLGYPSYSVGLFLGLSVFAEIIIFMLAGKLFRHLTIKIALMSSLLLTAIRWFFMAEFAEYMLFIILAQLLHAASFGINHSASMLFLQQHFEPSHQSRAQAIYVGGIYGLGGALGAWISGILWQQGDGASLTFYLAGMTSMVACLVIAISANTQISK